jgi:hypothetical protein
MNIKDCGILSAIIIALPFVLVMCSNIVDNSNCNDPSSAHNSSAHNEEQK